MLFDHCTVLFIVYEGRHIINDDYNDDNICCIWGGIFWGVGWGQLFIACQISMRYFNPMFFFSFFYGFMILWFLVDWFNKRMNESTAEIKLLSVSENDCRYSGILFPVSILTYVQLSACHFTSACKFRSSRTIGDGVMTSYRIFKMMARVGNLLPGWGLVTASV